MKKALSLLLLLALIMVPILSACSSNSETASDDKGKSSDNGDIRFRFARFPG